MSTTMRAFQLDGPGPPQVFGLEQIREAQAVMEANEAVGKLVVRVTHPGP